MFIIKFDINTDGDFTYEKSDIKYELADDIKNATEKLLERLKKTIKSIEHQKIKLMLKKIYNQIKKLKYFKTLYFSFDYGNYSGEFEIAWVKNI